MGTTVRGYKQFNWNDSTPEEVAQKILSDGWRRATVQMMAYKRSGDVAMMQKIGRARKIAELLEMEECARVLREELYGNIESGVGNGL